MRLSSFLNAVDPERKHVRDGTWHGAYGTPPYTKTLSALAVGAAAVGADLLLVDLDDTLLRSTDTGASLPPEYTDPAWPDVLRAVRAARGRVVVVSSRTPEHHASGAAALVDMGLEHDGLVYTNGALKTDAYLGLIEEHRARRVVIVDDTSTHLKWGARALMCRDVDVEMFHWCRP